jgi:type VI secretion system protein ImpH
MSGDAQPDPPTALATLFDELAAAPHAHDFFHTLRRIETALPNEARLGRALRPALEPVRLGQDPELDFAPAALMSFGPQKHAPPRLGVRFFGLFGPQGPLPLHLTEYARERERHHADAGFARFADLFHHRLLTLFYRAWAQAQPTVHVDRPHDDQFGKWIGALFGIGAPEFRGRDHVADAAKRFHAGSLARGVKNAEGLETILREQLRTPVRVESFVGHWMRLRPREQTRLGAGHAAEPSAQLGVSAVAGSKVWDRQYKFRVAVGPLRWSQYVALLPGGRSMPVLRDWVRQFAGLSRSWDLRLTLAAADVPRARLGRAGDGGRTTRLGLSSWLGGAPRLGRTLDRNDLLLHPEALRTVS